MDSHEPNEQQPIALSYCVPAKRSPRWLAELGSLSAMLFLFGIVLAFLFGFMTGKVAGTVLVILPFAALACGIAARAMSAKTDRDLRGMALFAMVMAGAEIALLLTLAFISWQSPAPRENFNRHNCASNLRQIGQAMLLYSLDNGGAYPPTPDLLLLTQDMSSEVMVCPSTNDAKAPGTTAQQITQNFQADPKHSSYVYTAASLRRGFGPPKQIMAYDKSLNAHDGMNVLYEDGSVEFLDKKLAKHVLAELAAGHNPPRPMSR
jgi:hypothetical protein